MLRMCAHLHCLDSHQGGNSSPHHQTLIISDVLTKTRKTSVSPSRPSLLRSNTWTGIFSYQLRMYLKASSLMA